MRRAAFTGVLLLMSGSAAAQQRFEVASVKPHAEDGAGTGRSGIEETQSAVRIENLPLWVVVRAAYGVTDSALIAPGWLKDARFDITAKPPAGYTHAMLGPLLQTLLAERFGMQAHREERPLNAYALRVARGGAKLKESTGPRGYLTGRPGLIAGNARTVKELAGSLAGQLKTAVADETGLTGAYDIKLEWTPDEAASGTEAGPSLSAALREQLGLSLEVRKTMTSVVVVDRINRTPVEN